MSVRPAKYASANDAQHRSNLTVDRMPAPCSTHNEQLASRNSDLPVADALCNEERSLTGSAHPQLTGFFLNTVAETNVIRRPTGSGSMSVNAMLTSGFL